MECQCSLYNWANLHMEGHPPMHYMSKYSLQKTILYIHMYYRVFSEILYKQSQPCMYILVTEVWYRGENVTRGYKSII